MTVFVLSLLLVACGDEKEIKSWIAKTNDLLFEATKQSEVIPYQLAQHEALRSYFAELAVKIATVKESAKATKSLNSVLTEMDLNDVCTKILMPKAQWVKVMQRCTKNRYFLCSEEVRAYPDVIASLMLVLNADMKKKFSETEACRIAL